MPYTTSWGPNKEFLLYTLEGEFTGEDVLRATQEGIALTEGRLGAKNFCWDTRGITSLVIAPSDVLEIARRMKHYGAANPVGRTAIVTKRFTAMLMAELLVIKGGGSGRVRKRFDSMDEAIAWLTSMSGDEDVNRHTDGEADDFTLFATGLCATEMEVFRPA